MFTLSIPGRNWLAAALTVILSVAAPEALAFKSYAEGGTVDCHSVV